MVASALLMAMSTRPMSTALSASATVRPSRKHRETGSSIASPLISLRSRMTSPICMPCAPRRSQPVSCSATGFKYSTQPDASVVMTASPIDFSVTCARSFSLNSARSAALRCVTSVIVPSQYSTSSSSSRTMREFSTTMMTLPLQRRSRYS